MNVMSAGHRLPPFREIAYGANGGPATEGGADPTSGAGEKVVEGPGGDGGTGAGLIGAGRANAAPPLTLQQQQQQHSMYQNTPQQLQQQHGPLSSAPQSRTMAHQQPLLSTGLPVSSQKSGVFGAGGNQGILPNAGVNTNNLRRPQGVERLPLESLGQDASPSEAYLGERYFQHPLPPQVFGVPNQQQINMSRTLSGNTPSWMGATSLSDGSLLNPSFSSLTSSGRGGGAVGATGTMGVTSGAAGLNANVGNMAWGPGGNVQYNAGTGGAQGSSLPRSASPLGLGGIIGASGTGGGVPSPTGWSQDWGISGDEIGQGTNVANAARMGMAAAAAAAAVADGTSKAEATALAGGNTLGNTHGGIGGSSLGGSRGGRLMYSGNASGQNDIAILNSLSNQTGTTMGLGSQNMGYSGSLDPINALGPSTHGGSIGQQQQQPSFRRPQQPPQRFLQRSSQQQSQQLGLLDSGLGQSGLQAGTQAGVQAGAQAGPRLSISPSIPSREPLDPLRSALPRTQPPTLAPIVQRRGRGPGRRRTLGDDEIEIELTSGERAVLTRGSDGKFPCPECNKKLVNSSTLQNHIKSVHQNAGKHICQFCPPNKRKFMWASTLDIHIRHVHRRERPYPCPFEGCPQGFRWQSHLQEHIIVSHEKRRDYTCPVCKKDFGRKNNWQKHIRNVHRVKDVAGFLAKYKATGGDLQQSLMFSNQAQAGPSILQRQTSRYRTAPQVEVPPMGLPPQQRRHRPDATLQSEEHFQGLQQLQELRQQPAHKRARRG